MAAEFRASRPELAETRLPPLILQDRQRLNASWRAARPYFTGSLEDADEMSKYITENNLPWNVQSLDLAFEELVAAGRISVDLEHLSVKTGAKGSNTMVYHNQGGRSGQDQFGRGQTNPTPLGSRPTTKPIRSMTAIEYAEYLTRNPEAREKIDNGGEE